MTLCIFFCFAPQAFAMQSITVVADEAVSLAVAQLAREYARTQNVSVNTSFLPKEALDAQLLEGGAADVLITMDSKWVATLKLQGLLDIYSQATFGRGQLALVGPASSPISLDAKKPIPSSVLIHAMAFEPAFYLGNPEFLPEGKFSKEALRNLGLFDALEPYTLYVKDREEMLGEVKNNGAFGLFVYSATLSNNAVKALYVLPEKSHAPMEYMALVVAGEQMDEARKFLKFLKTTEAKNIIKAQGLLVD